MISLECLTGTPVSSFLAHKIDIVSKNAVHEFSVLTVFLCVLGSTNFQVLSTFLNFIVLILIRRNMELYINFAFRIVHGSSVQHAAKYHPPEHFWLSNKFKFRNYPLSVK